MSPHKIKPFIPSILMVLVCLPYIARTNLAFPLNKASFLTYHFAHINVWHFLLNATALIYFRPRIKTLAVAIVSASIAPLLITGSFLLPEPVCGLSGVVFAAYARKYAVYSKSPVRLLLINFFLFLVPGYCWGLHLVSFLLAYMIWDILKDKET